MASQREKTQCKYDKLDKLYATLLQSDEIYVGCINFRIGCKFQQLRLSKCSAIALQHSDIKIMFRSRRGYAYYILEDCIHKNVVAEIHHTNCELRYFEY